MMAAMLIILLLLPLWAGIGAAIGTGLVIRHYRRKPNPQET